MWAQQLLGADAWRNTAMCRSELGWALSGSGSAIYDMAMKRASFWVQADTTLAGKSFVAAHLSDGNTWAKRSRSLLEQWEVQDWPAWLATRSSSTKYCTYVKGDLAATCMRDWTPAAQKHVRPLPYLSLTAGPTTMLNDALRLRLAWAVLVGHRELIRLWRGLLRLSHVARKRSQASIQFCIFCQCRFRNVYKHVVRDCPVQADSRVLIQNAGVDCSTCVFLATAPSSSAFRSVVGFAVAVGSGERSFWTAGSG
ncbi:unnamed protein product [Polarella glacialis]|uniref:Uncharacterized protein n=1 Tax=Polarella glacialis TaxID=89957 RepID=A0A813FKW2_POLGL|nr:unnamed protein product [Polarella glacialis]